MFGKTFKLFTIFGFTVKMDVTWLIIGLLITWSLATGVFPQMYEGLDTRIYWLMGLGGALGLLVSIVWHELCHSLVARRYGLPMSGITLFIFGGVAEMTREPPSAKAEFLMAIAGPISSVVLAILLFAVNLAGTAVLQWPPPLTGALLYLAVINIVLAIFNMIPGFPLDGGRVLRSILWYWKNNLRWATRIASNIGAAFGMIVIFMGIFQLIATENWLGGIWFIFIGMFLRSAAQSSYQQMLLRDALSGEEIQHFMTADPIAVTSDMTLRQLVEDYVYRHHHKLFPVVDDGRLKGCVTTAQIRQVPQEQWESRTVGDVTQQCSRTNTISPTDDAMDALSRMNRTKASRLMVTTNGNLVGIITLKDLLEFFSLKVELEENEPMAPSSVADIAAHPDHSEE